MNVTFQYGGTCQCGADRKGFGFLQVRVNKHSLRTTAPSLFVTAPCPNGSDQDGHTPAIDWDKAAPDDESRDAIEAYRRRKGWAE